MSDNGDIILTDIGLSEEERRCLQVLVGMMIPSSGEYGVPGADDAEILADIVRTAREYMPVLKESLQSLNELSANRYGKELAALEGEDRSALVDEFKASQVPFIRMLVSITAQCYYRDDRVVMALGMEARAPHPGGFEVEDGDWSLLEPVRQRGKFYRETDSS